MSVSGGLYDQDPEPDRHRTIVSEATVKGAQREWAFWIVMAIGLWASFQGQPATVFLFMGMVLIVTSAIFLGREIKRQWSEAMKKRS